MQSDNKLVVWVKRTWAAKQERTKGCDGGYWLTEEELSVLRHELEFALQHFILEWVINCQQLQWHSVESLLDAEEFLRNRTNTV